MKVKGKVCVVTGAAGGIGEAMITTAGFRDVIEMREPNRTLRIEKRGFPETVVWNPGAEGTRTRADFADGEERHMVCVEAAVVRPPVLLASGDQWVGTQLMTAVR